MSPKFKFLNRCIEYLEEHGLLKPQAADFHQKCLYQIAQNEPQTIDTKAIELLMESEGKTKAAGIQRLKKLIKLIDSNRTKLETFLPEFDLMYFFNFAIEEGGGYGQATKFRVDKVLDAVVKHDNAIEAPIAEAEINEQCSKPVLNETRIDYNKFPIKKSKAPWYFKYTAHLYETLKGRYVLASFALFPNLIIYLAFIYVWYTSEKQIPIFSFEILFTVFALALWLPFYAIPSYKVLTLAINKIRSINDYSGFVITEATNEEGILAPLQYFKITGTCPICANNNNLQNSVYIRPIQKSLFVRQLIGECKNNPTVHKFSFDKVTMKGTRFKL